ncbi:TIGR00266 family protein [Aureibacter tunicatorum]|uniref:Uncharacterized protein (TIGR00266 family) n=1 Tax=Aureibacter tunicatorum TaxID=866807 RepID=A0AAE3XSV2_9BACT|nr:TIGR00266 family protein [Aureibacter tunicatorum]MDR6241835.1 uncharacterized protein (TIGR00266 family) [Aureibacter tunicatorum]BDD07082.1 TIGR00266 family protein [Aureibacter tunicatorum]
MKITLNGQPAFAYVDIDIAPGETLIAESDAMASMSTRIGVEPKLNGGFFKGIARKFLGGESLFVNHFNNASSEPQRLTITQGVPGDMIVKELNDEKIYLQPGAYICSTPDVNIGIEYAGLNSFIAKEGLFRLVASGTGTIVYGAYGGLIEKQVTGEFIVDTSHLVSYEPQLKLKTQLSGSLISSLTSGEGFVTRIEGTGKIVIQTRSLTGLASWVNRFFH